MELETQVDGTVETGTHDSSGDGIGADTEVETTVETGAGGGTGVGT